MTSEFLIFVPSDWTALQNPEIWFPQWDLNAIRDYIDRESWGEIDSLFETTGQLPAGFTVSKARLVDTISGGADQPQLYLQFIPIPPNPA